MSIFAKVALTTAAISAIASMFLSWKEDSALSRAMNFPAAGGCLVAVVEMWVRA